MSRHDPLVVHTHVAHAGHRDHSFHGHRVYQDLAGRVSLAGLVAIGINGRRLKDDEAAILDDIAVVWTIADPRIWPPKVSRLASAYGGSVEGIAAGLLCMDCSYVGIWQSSPATARWLIELRDALGDVIEDPHEVAKAADRLVSRRKFIPGFGVPYREEDERVPPMWKCLKARGRDQLPFVQLFAQIGAVVQKERGMHSNIAGLVAAICLDLSFRPDEIGPLLIYLAAHMFVANAHEGAEQAPEVLQRIPDDRVRYIGPAPRISPRAVEHERDVEASELVRKR